MVVVYDFGDGEEFEYEVEYTDRVEAIANYMAENYIQHVIKKHKPSSAQANKLWLSKQVLLDAFYYTLKDFDLVSDSFEDEMEDVIKDYWEKDAREQWNNSRD